jgi:HK97 family phage major capsid protein
MEQVTLSMEELTSLLKNSFAEQAKAMGLDKIDRKHGIFPGSGENGERTKDDRLKTWLRAVVLRDPEDIAMTKDEMTITTTVGLGFAPDEFRTEVIRVAENFGLIRRLASVFPTDAPSVNLHQANGVVTVSWFNEQDAITESGPTFTEPEIAIKKAAGITAMSKELFADAKFPVVSYVAGLFGEALAGAEDSQGLVGTGSPYHGLVGGTISGQVSVSADSATSPKDFSADDLLSLPMGVAEKYRNGGAYFMHPTILSYLTKAFKTLQGDPILRTPREDGLATSLWGYPVHTSEKLPTTDAVATKLIGFANPKRCYLFDRQAMEVSTSDSATLATAGNLWQTDQIALKVTERVGIGWTLGAGTAVLLTHA